MAIPQLLAAWLLLRVATGDIGNVCEGANISAGGCYVDGTGCVGDAVEFDHYEMTVFEWDAATRKNVLHGRMSSYAIVGSLDTWQMYLHGPLLRPNERESPTSIPPLYTHATWTNKIYRFDGFSQPHAGKNLTARQKLVGWADAPSTSFPLEDSDKKLNGLMVAEGQPFWLSSYGGIPWPLEIGKGGVSYLPNRTNEKCEKMFPTDVMKKMFGEVVNTVDCHKRLGVCFFTVWKFYDDQDPVWSPISDLIAEDCLHYCIVDGLDKGVPSCRKTAVVVDETGQSVCHKKGVGAVHGMTIGLDDPGDPTMFDIFLIFTGGAKFDKGESSMRKLRVSFFDDLKVVTGVEFGTQLFVDVPNTKGIGYDAGGDHAWVDDTGKYLWVSTFRTAAAGVHMLDYVTGDLLYSVTGLDHYLPDQYLYSAGIHGTGTLGRKGSYIAVAASACTSVAVCAPIPWTLGRWRERHCKDGAFVARRAAGGYAIEWNAQHGQHHAGARDSQKLARPHCASPCGQPRPEHIHAVAASGKAVSERLAYPTEMRNVIRAWIEPRIS